jgi:CRP-like cAMP-binding protein
MGVVNAIYSQMTWVPLAIVFVMVSGFANAPSAIARGLIVQRNTPREVRGRVSSVFAVTRSVAFLIGMSAAGLADVWGVRALTLGSAVLVLVPGVLALVLPGLGQPAADWLRSVRLLRSAAAAPKAGTGRAATLADFDALVGKLPALSGLSTQDRRNLITGSRVVVIKSGTAILHKGETGDAVYFILDGRAVAGIETEAGDYRSLETMRPGDFFGEIAALMGTARTANVVADEPTTLLLVPGTPFRNMMKDARISQIVHRKFLERVARTSIGDLPRFASLDQQDLRELRTGTGS